MFYTKEDFFEEIDEYLVDILSIEENLIIDSKYRGRIESDLRISLIIKATGVFENLYYDIIKEFAVMHSSSIFHEYFKERFKNEGKNVKPDVVNGLLKILGVRVIKKEENPSAYTALSSLYEIRNQTSHGNLNFSEPIEKVRQYISDSKDFFRLLIKRFEEYSICHPLEKRK